MDPLTETAPLSALDADTACAELRRDLDRYAAFWAVANEDKEATLPEPTTDRDAFLDALLASSEPIPDDAPFCTVHEAGACFPGCEHAYGPEARWLVLENTPGYLPDDNDPPVFDDRDAAVAYLAERLEEHVATILDEGGAPTVSWSDDREEAFVEDSNREHDLGRWFGVIQLDGTEDAA
jgi:hypothetical protein